MSKVKCKNCGFSCLRNRPEIIIRKLDGTIIYVNPDMYCSKDCFTMKNLLKNNYNCLYSSSDEKLEVGNVQRTRVLCFRKDENKSKKEKTN
tara:strand:- start:1571 stop:1843 length:273 start_codon:yes stop_codon:yes gene_type:complete